MDRLIQHVISWAQERNLIEGSTPKAQLLKTLEELGELAKAINKDDLAGVVDGVGDVLVTLIILCAQKGLTVEQCLSAAYEEIKDRRGRMVDGVFVKEADL